MTTSEDTQAPVPPTEPEAQQAKPFTVPVMPKPTPPPVQAKATAPVQPKPEPPRPKTLEELISDPDVDPNVLAEALLAVDNPNIGQLQQRLPYVGEKPGWRRYWVLSMNVPRRLAEGWRFVARSSIQMASTGLGFGNYALGDNVEVPAGRSEIDDKGNASKLHLMEIPEAVAQHLTKVNVTNPTRAIEAALKGPGGVDNLVPASHNPYAARQFAPGSDAVVKSSL